MSHIPATKFGKENNIISYLTVVNVTRKKDDVFLIGM
jgi:hypothetical protein